MAKLSLLAAVIISSMHTGYRRAGIAFDKGENTVEVDEIQLAKIEQDHNLLVQSTESIEPGADSSSQGNVDADSVDKSITGPSVDDVTLDLSHAPKELHAIIAAVHAKQCQEPLTRKPNCDEFGGLKVSGADRDAAWAWYQDNVINHVPD
ncbi:HI1506-related protein [Colwellia psychrerythraea]|uniref:Mu-like prophage FluMu N-terminal domain-containing protein n=1 Tax=Colwellia psychrerythraea TaxID=28229 RepID=A0A099K9Z3_COLPS|nr:HI1506-related protein [Colwellia psychrerythraea]KGJ86443.1 hypothetical protein ND2E_1009 [Colwellia psychrerythraea]